MRPDAAAMLALDVDGVISLFGFEGPISRGPRPLPPDQRDGPLHPRRDRWDARAPRRAATRSSGRPGGRIAPTSACRTSSASPGQLPFLTFDGESPFRDRPLEDRRPSTDYAGERPLAWVDDCDRRDLPCVGGRALSARPSWSRPSRHRPDRGPRGGPARLGPCGVHCLTRGGVLADLLPGGDPEDPDRRRCFTSSGGRSSRRRRPRRPRRRPSDRDSAALAPRADRGPRGPRRGGPHAPDALPLPSCPPGGRTRISTAARPGQGGDGPRPRLGGASEHETV